MLRSFIAIEIPAEIQAALTECVAALRKALPKPLVRWVTPGNIHLTLKFLGDVLPADLTHLAEVLKTEVLRYDPFTLIINGFGAFPNPERARILWIGIEAPAALLTLAGAIDSAAAKAGFEKEARPFSPHLTIGRVGQNLQRSDQLQIRTALTGFSVGQLGTIQVKAVQIYQSDLRPDGAVYSRLYSLPLRSGS
jgi:RNA 2',3'-cyclic 3'-phosphodiesterase